MGAAVSRQVGQQAEISKQWLLDFRDSAIKHAYGASLEAFHNDGTKILALAYQASDQAYPGSANQHLRFQISKDGGETWSPSRVVMWGIAPVWSPVLFYDPTSSRLFLFYSESRKAYSPGGDIKYISSTDLGATWTSPVTIYTHEADGEVPKVIANRPVAAGGAWFLAFHREPLGSYKTFNSKTFTSLAEAESDAPTLPVPPTAAAQSLTTSAGVLISRDQGATWTVGGTIEDARTWLIQPSVELGSKGQLVMLFRTAVGKAYYSWSSDQGATWSAAVPTTGLLSPNSKFSSLTIDGQILVAHNPSATGRNVLSLALSVDDGKTFEALVTFEDEADSKFCSPSITEWTEDTVKIVYTEWGRGLKMATIKLATVDS